MIEKNEQEITKRKLLKRQWETNKLDTVAEVSKTQCLSHIYCFFSTLTNISFNKISVHTIQSFFSSPKRVLSFSLGAMATSM